MYFKGIVMLSKELLEFFKKLNQFDKKEVSTVKKTVENSTTIPIYCLTLKYCYTKAE